MAGLDPGVQGAVGFVVGAAARAVVGAGLEVGEGVDDAGEVDVCQSERADSGGVDHPPGPFGQPQCDRRRRGVPPAAGHLVDTAYGPKRAGYQLIDERRLTHAAVADEDGTPAAEPFAHVVQANDAAVIGDLGDHPGNAQRGIAADERSGIGEVGLGQQQQRFHSGVVGRDQASVDHPRSRLRLGQGGDDGELVCVGDDDPLEGIGVVGGPAQH